MQQQGTMLDAPNFNAERDADALNKAVKGFGTKESVLIDILGNRSNAQRLKIKDMYKAMFGKVMSSLHFSLILFLSLRRLIFAFNKELSDDLKGDTSGNFQKLLTALLMTPVEFDCMEMRKAIQGLGTDDSTLIEILTSRSNKRLKDISTLYLQRE